MSHVIVSCFAGTGMNYAIDKLKDKFSIDKIEKLKDFYIKYPTPEKYQKDVIVRSEKCDILFIPYFLNMNDRFLKHKIDYYMIYPNKSCKEEYLQRYKDLEFTEEQINNFKNNWNAMINDCRKQDNAIELKSGEYAMEKIEELLKENGKTILKEDTAGIEAKHDAAFRNNYAKLAGLVKHFKNASVMKRMVPDGLEETTYCTKNIVLHGKNGKMYGDLIINKNGSFGYETWYDGQDGGETRFEILPLDKIIEKYISLSDGQTKAKEEKTVEKSNTSILDRVYNITKQYKKIRYEDGQTGKRIHLSEYMYIYVTDKFIKIYLHDLNKIPLEVKQYLRDNSNIFDDMLYTDNSINKFLAALPTLLNKIYNNNLNESLESLVTRPKEFFKKVQLWRVSLFKEDKVGQHSFNPGTKLSKPRMSSFWICGDKDWTYLYGFRIAITKMYEDNTNDVFNPDKPKEWVNKMKDQCRFDLSNGEGFCINSTYYPEEYVRSHFPTVYLYGLKIHGYETGAGWHNPNEYTIDKDVTPDSVEELNYDFFKKNLIIKYLPDDEYKQALEEKRQRKAANSDKPKWDENIGFPYFDDPRNDVAVRYNDFFNKMIKSAMHERDQETQEKLMTDIANKFKLINNYKLKLTNTSVNDINIPDQYKHLFFDNITESAKFNYKTNYTNYVIDHIANVKKGYFWIKDNCPEMLEKCDKKKVEENLIVHDESKWSIEEFEPYALYFYGGERTDKITEDFNKAWEHHYRNNKHHPEWWKGLPMSEEYIIEMICDWWSFSWRTGNLGEIFNFWLENKEKKSKYLTPEVQERVQILLNMLHKKLQLLDLI